MTKNFFSSTFMVKELDGKGQGLVTTGGVEKGELLIREKAMELVQGGWETDKLLVLNHLLENVHVKIMKDPGVRTEVEALYPSKDVSKKDFEWRDFSDKGQYPETLVEELNHLYNIITCNTFKVEDVTGNNEVSFAIFLRTSRLNHSCAPNCHYYCTDGSINIRATTAIPPNTELTISYCNEYLSRPQRMSHLRKNYNFTCTCPRCADLTLLDVTLDSVKCPTTDCLGYVTGDKAGTQRCTECGVAKKIQWKKDLHAEVERKPDTTLTLCHPQSALAYNTYIRTITTFFTSLGKRSAATDTPEARGKALSAAKSAIACLQASNTCPCERLLLTLKASALCQTEGEKAAFRKKAEEICEEVRGDRDLKTHFPVWVK